MNVTQMFGVTVASMGKFNSKDIDDAFTYDAEAGYGYCKLCYKDGLIVGDMSRRDAGGGRDIREASPIIRRRLAANCAPAKLDAFLNVRLFEK